MRLTHVLVLCVQKAAFCKESFVFTCLTYRNVQCFRNWPLDEFHRLKASQITPSWGDAISDHFGSAACGIEFSGSTNKNNFFFLNGGFRRSSP